MNLFLLATDYNLDFVLDKSDIYERFTELGFKPVSEKICPLLACSEWYRQIFFKPGKCQNKKLSERIKKWQNEVIKLRLRADLSQTREFVEKIFEVIQNKIENNRLRIQVEIEPKRDENGSGKETEVFYLLVRLWIENHKLPLGVFANGTTIKPENSQEDNKDIDLLFESLKSILPYSIRKARFGLLHTLCEVKDLAIEIFLPFDHFNSPLENISFPVGRRDRRQLLGKEYPIFINSFERYFDEGCLEIRSDIQKIKEILWETNKAKKSQKSPTENFSIEDIYIGTRPSESELIEVEETLPIAFWSRKEAELLMRTDELISNWRKWPKLAQQMRRNRTYSEITLFWDDLFPKPSIYTKNLNTDVVYQ